MSLAQNNLMNGDKVLLGISARSANANQTPKVCYVNL